MELIGAVLKVVRLCFSLLSSLALVKDVRDLMPF